MPGDDSLSDSQYENFSNLVLGNKLANKFLPITSAEVIGATYLTACLLIQTQLAGKHCSHPELPIFCIYGRYFNSIWCIYVFVFIFQFNMMHLCFCFWFNMIHLFMFSYFYSIWCIYSCFHISIQYDVFIFVFIFKFNMLHVFCCKHFFCLLRLVDFLFLFNLYNVNIVMYVLQ